MAWYVSLAVRSTLVWLLVGSAIEKLWLPANLEGLIRSRFGWEDGRSRAAVRYLSLAEFACAAILLVPRHWWIGAIGCVKLFGVFAFVVAHWARSGISGDCGCGGLMPTHSVSAGHVLLALFLALVSAAMAAFGLSSSPSAVASGTPFAAELLLFLVPLPILLALSILSALRQVNAQLRSLFPSTQGA